MKSFSTYSYYILLRKIYNKCKYIWLTNYTDLTTYESMFANNNNRVLILNMNCQVLFEESLLNLVNYYKIIEFRILDICKQSIMSSLSKSPKRFPYQHLIDNFCIRSSINLNREKENIPLDLEPIIFLVSVIPTILCTTVVSHETSGHFPFSHTELSILSVNFSAHRSQVLQDICKMTLHPEWYCIYAVHLKVCLV
jgi:hypothetical protein